MTHPVIIYKTIKTDSLKAAIQDIFLPVKDELIYPALMDFIQSVNFHPKKNHKINHLLEVFCYNLLSEQGKYIINFEKILDPLDKIKKILNAEIESSNSKKNFLMLFTMATCTLSSGTIATLLGSALVGFPLGAGIGLCIGILTTLIFYCATYLVSEKPSQHSLFNLELYPAVSTAVENRKKIQIEQELEIDPEDKSFSETAPPSKDRFVRNNHLYSKKFNLMVFSGSHSVNSKNNNDEAPKQHRMKSQSSCAERKQYRK